MEAAAKGSRDAEEHFASTRSHTESHCRADLLDFIRSENAHQRFKAVQRQRLHLKAVCRRVFLQSVALRRIEIHQPRDSQVLRIPAGDGHHDAQGQVRPVAGLLRRTPKPLGSRSLPSRGWASRVRRTPRRGLAMD